MNLKEIETIEREYTTSYVIEPNEELGFLLPFVVIIPKDEVCNHVGLSLPTPMTSNDNMSDTLEKLKQKSGMSNKFFKLKMPIIYPLIPRFKNYYTSLYSSDVFNNNLNKIDNSNLTDEDKKRLIDIHKQIYNMVKYGITFLREMGIDVKDKVVVDGYSATGKFANLFTALHPDIVSACISGASAGLLLRPIKEIDGRPINFPLGINDVDINFEEFSHVPQFYYQGLDDFNDAALCKCELEDETDKLGNPIAKRDENGHPIPILIDGFYSSFDRECYKGQEIDIIYKYFGQNPQERFLDAEKYYREMGANATFKMYKGDHITICQSEEVANDIENFIKENVLELDKQNMIGR